MKYSKDKEKLLQLVRTENRYKTLDRLAAEIIRSTTSSSICIGEREEEVNMCKALEDMCAEATENGIKQGLQRGTENTLLNAIQNVIEAFHVTAEQAMRCLKVPEADFDRYLSKLP